MTDLSQYSIDPIGAVQNDYSFIQHLYTQPPTITNTQTNNSYQLYVPDTARFFTDIPEVVTATDELVPETENTDEWVEKIQAELQRNDRNQITNGYVSTLNQITDDEITFDTTTYFNARSSLEKHVFNTVQTKSAQEIDKTFLSGITHTLLLSPTDTDNTYVIIGRNSQSKAIQFLQYNTAPAGLIEPHHLKETLHNTIKEHFCEEAPEELLHNKISFSEFKESFNSEGTTVSITPTSFYIDRFSHSSEISTVIHISGQLADFILEALNPNQEYSTVTNYPLDIFGKNDDFPIDLKDFTRQSRVSLLLMLCSEYDHWTLDNRNP
jgi:hypothetical protein